MAGGGLKKEYLGPVVLKPFARFAEFESAGGIMLILCTVIAMAWANSPWHESYFHLWHTHASVGFGDWAVDLSLHHWINDALMAIFFFVVGLEIKREMLVGELAQPKQAALPIAAAIGGMVAPALIYTAFNFGKEGIAGWGIPMATDIAFAIGVLSMLGNRVPLALKIFLMALAIVDDLGAVLVIAIFYTTDLSALMLGIAFAVLAFMFILNRLEFRSPLIFFVLGGAVWYFFLLSGVHATIAGVLGALVIPSRTKIDADDFVWRSRALVDLFNKEEDNKSANYGILTGVQQDVMAMLKQRVSAAESPMQRLEYTLHPWVMFAIMPIFALANAGVRVSSELASNILHPVSLGIIFGLVFGKQIGIWLFSLFAVRTGVASLPDKVESRDIYSVSWLGGIGFTMSLFIANLAFPDRPDLLDTAKIGVLTASVISAVGGWILLSRRYKTA